MEITLSVAPMWNSRILCQAKAMLGLSVGVSTKFSLYGLIQSHAESVLYIIQ